MLQEKVYKKFKTMFPQYSEHVIDWFPNGKDSIRVRMRNGSDFIFTYHNPFDWRSETVESFIRDMQKGGRTMNVRLHDNLHENK